MLDNTTKQPSKLRTGNWVEIKFKMSMVRSYFCDYSDPYILVSGTITITGKEDEGVIKNRSLWQYRDDRNDNLTQSESFTYKLNITAKLLLVVIQRMLK